MKILICIPWYFPAYKAGGPVQSVRNLIDAGWRDTEFYVFTGSVDLDGTLLQGVLFDQWVDMSHHCRVYYRKDSNSSLVIRKVLKDVKFDLVFVNGIYSFHFNILPIWWAKDIRILLSARGMLHPGALSQKSLKKKVYLPFLRILMGMRHVEFHATDAEEMRFISLKMGGSYQVHVAPNFARIFKPVMHMKQVNELRLITVALVSPMKNHHLVLEGLSKVETPVQYDIVGPVKDHAYWDLCQDLIRKLPGHIRVTYHGAVPPDQIEEMLHQANVFICPSKSENFGHGFIEAMSAGLPVITSEHTPWNQLQIKKSGLNLEDSVDAITEGIRFFAKMDQQTFQIWSAAAHKYGTAAINHERLMSEYQKIFHAESC